MRLRVGAALLALGVLAIATACESRVVKLERKKSALRAEATQIVDDLYREFGGGPIASAISPPGPGLPSEVARRALSEADRRMFLEAVTKLGRGEHVVALTEKAMEFFGRSDVVARARRQNDLLIQLAEVQREIEKLTAAEARQK